MISSVVLAAGRTDRTGEQKLLVPLGGKPVLQWVLESALASNLREIICVARDLEAARRKIYLRDERLYWLANPEAEQGQSTSVTAGLWAIDPKSDGALFLAGDQPMIRPELINSLMKRFENTNALIVAPSVRGQTRHPILFRRDLFPKLLQLTGDQSGRILIDKHRETTSFIEWNDEMSFKDIDGRGDYEGIEAVD